MKLEILKRVMTGIAFAGIITFIALTILVLNQVESSVFTIWMYMLGSILLGIYFGLASFIFTNNGWSPLMKTVVHFSISIIFYFIIALSMEWVPFTLLAIFLTSVAFTVIYVIYWTAYQLYYKRIEASMNEDLQRRK